MGDNRGKTEMSAAAHISIRWSLLVGVLESAEHIWQPLNPVLSDEGHCVASASVTSDNCQLVLQFAPFRAADNTTLLLELGVDCRCSRNRNQSHSDLTCQISQDSHKFSQRSTFFLSLVVFYSIQSSMRQPSLSLQPAVETIHPFIKLSGWALSGLSTLG